MRIETQSRETSFGYLSTVHVAEHGYFGGYLIVSVFGRPLEFHCTSPVRPSRAQEILYGPTLHAYLLGEQIGGALLEAAKLKPRLILTQDTAMLAVRSVAGVPMVRLVAKELDDRQSLPGESTVASSAAPASSGRPEFQMAPGFESDQDAVAEWISILAEHVELAEPFGRIHEAICEAQRIGGRPVDNHGQAA